MASAMHTSMKSANAPATPSPIVQLKNPSSRPHKLWLGAAFELDLACALPEDLASLDGGLSDMGGGMALKPFLR